MVQGIGLGCVYIMNSCSFSRDGSSLKIFLNYCYGCAFVAAVIMLFFCQTNDIDAPLTAQCCTPCGTCQPNVEEEEDYFTAPFYKDGT